MTLTVSQLLAHNTENPEAFYRMLMDTISSQLRVAIPGIIQSFDADTQTCTVQPAIQERVQNPDLSYSWVSLPLLVDVPVQFPRGGGFSITFPLQKGDECLLVFSDMCLDSWWTSGEVGNQMDKRRHDLSDATAIVGITSQARKLSNYATDAMQMRTDDGSTYITMKSNEIDIQASTVKINGINFSSHVHSDPQGGTTGTPQ